MTTVEEYHIIINYLTRQLERELINSVRSYFNAELARNTRELQFAQLSRDITRDASYHANMVNNMDFEPTEEERMEYGNLMLSIIDRISSMTEEEIAFVQIFDPDLYENIIGTQSDMLADDYIEDLRGDASVFYLIDFQMIPRIEENIKELRNRQPREE